MCKGHLVVPAVRQSMILEEIRGHGSGKIRELAERLGVSEATVRRDLIDLAKQGFVTRTHGGAMVTKAGAAAPTVALPPPVPQPTQFAVKPSDVFEFSYRDRLSMEVDKKKRIADVASTYIRDGDALFLDTGTTNHQVALRLAYLKYITLITNDLYIASNVELHPTSSIILAGGSKREGYNILVGPINASFIRNIQVNIVLMSCDCIDPDWGVSTTSFLEADVKKCLLDIAEEVILPVDSTKFGKKTIAKICDLKRFSRVITDSDLAVEHREALYRLQVPFELVGDA